MEFGGLIVGLVAGLVVGGLVVFLWRRDGATASKELESTRSEMNSYRQEVTEHYVKTAELVDRLTQDYKSLFEHLNEGAMKQMNPEVLEQKLAHRSAAPVVLGVLGREGLPAPSGDAVPQPPDAEEAVSVSSPAAEADEKASPLQPELETQGAVAPEDAIAEATSHGTETLDKTDDSNAPDASDTDPRPGAVNDDNRPDRPVAKGPDKPSEQH